VVLNGDSCYDALVARDARFDGLFFVGVSTTGIYCRPVCAARTPGRDRCTFFRTPAEAETAGYRACFRCRPELAPGGAPIDAVPRLVADALARIDEGYLNDNSVGDLAAELGVTDRHLRRAMEDEIGASPLAIAQSRRLAVAKQLLTDTGLGMAEIAFASGFRSVRRFDALFRQRFGRTPSSVRRAQRRPAAGAARAGDAPLRLRLDFRPPLAWGELLAFLRARAIPGVEVVTDREYRRTVRAGDGVGTVRVWAEPGRPALGAALSPSLGTELMKVVARLRALFDLDARPDVVAACLARDRQLGPLVRRRPGLRVPGAFDPFEMTVRAVLGQQVSVRAATTLAARLAERFGAPVEPAGPHGDNDGDGDGGGSGATPALCRLFPTPATLHAAGADALAAIGLPSRRAATLHAVAALFAGADGAAWARGAASGADAFAERLRAIPGVGDWTAEYVALRAFRRTDAFPAGDLGVRRALGGLSPHAARARSEAWRPWRAYAVMHLWTAPEAAPGSGVMGRRGVSRSTGPLLEVTS
jgi:AraC family transcriptional regulator of adaptative response / DNA-3-methyladenine glycosylase II